MIVRSSISSSSKQQQSIVYNHNNKTRRFSVLLVIYIHTYAHTVSLWVIQLSTQKTFLFLMLSMEKIHFDGISVIFWLIRLIWSKIGTNWNNLKMRFGLRGKEYLFLWPRKIGFDQHRTMARNRKYYTEQKRNEKNPIHLNENSNCNGVCLVCKCFIAKWFTLRLFRVCRCEVPQQQQQQQLASNVRCVCATIERKTNPKPVASFRLYRTNVSVSPAFLTFVTRTPRFEVFARTRIRTHTHTPAPQITDIVPNRGWISSI